MIIQNACQFEGKIYNSVSTHDFVVVVDRKTKTDNLIYYAIDGGKEYFRSVGFPPSNVIPLNLVDNDDIDEIRNNLLWGSLVSGSIVYNRIRDLSKEHIENILEDYKMGKQRIAPLHLEVLKYWKTNLK